MAKSDEVQVSVTLVDKVTAKAKKIKSNMDSTFTGIKKGSDSSTGSIKKMEREMTKFNRITKAVARGSKRDFDELKEAVLSLKGSVKPLGEEKRKLGVKAKKASRGVARLKGSVDGLSKASNDLKTIMGAGVLGVALLSVGKKAIDAKSKFEKLEMQFQTILGSSTKAKERMKELADFASSTPFKLEGISQASKILETLTQGALSTGEGLRMVGDASAIAGVPMEELAVHIGRANDSLKNNRPAGEAIMRMQELGLITGETRGKIEELQKQAKGKEAWNTLEKSLLKNSGAMVKLSETFEGKLSTLMDKVNDFYRALLNDNAFTNMKGGLEDLIELTQEWTTLLKGNLTMIEKIQKKENKSFQDLLTLSQARIAELKKERSLVYEYDNNKKRILDERIAKEEALSTRLAKAHQAEMKANKEKGNSDKKLSEAEAQKVKNKKAGEEQAKEESKLIKQFTEDQNAWKEEIGATTEGMKAFTDEQLRKNEALANDPTIGTGHGEQDQNRSQREKIEESILLDKKEAEEKSKINQFEAKESARLAFNEKKLEKEKTQAYIDSITMKQKVGKTGFLFAKAMFGENKKLAITEAIVQGVLATQKALASAPYPMNLVNAGLVAGQTAFNVSKMRKAEKGANFQTNGPELLLVGDNAGGKENVSVTPVNTPNMNGPKVGEGGGTNISITVQGNADESTVEKMARMIEDAVRDKAVNFRTLDGQEVITV